MTYTVTMQSDVYGGDWFYYATLAEALAAIRRLYRTVESLDDGLERVIGLVINRVLLDDFGVAYDDDEAETP